MSRSFEQTTLADRARRRAEWEASQPPKDPFHGCIRETHEQTLERDHGLDVVEVEAFYDRRSFALIGVRYPDGRVEFTSTPNPTQPAVIGKARLRRWRGLDRARP